MLSIDKLFHFGSKNFGENVIKSILVFPAGSEVGLEISRALTEIKDIKVIGATSVDDHSLFAFDKLKTLPFFDDKNFVSELNKLIIQESIDCIFPAHDDLVKLLPSLKARNLLQGDVKIISSPAITTEVARSKSLTYKKLSHVVSTPYTFLNTEEIKEFPVFAKPDIGQGSKGVFVVNNKRDMEKLNSELIVTEFLPGDEYTVDCFTDRSGKLLFHGARARKRVSNGISVSSVEHHDERISEMAHRINSSLEFRGAWFFQVKKRADDTPVLLEIACRVSGGMGFFRAKGVNLPLLSIYDHYTQSDSLEIFYNEYEIQRDSALHPRYKIGYSFGHVYIDLDDTLIFDDKTNYRLVSLLYKYKNENKKLYLITRHRETYKKDPLITLAEHCINKSLFDAVLEVGVGQEKSTFIAYTDAIFIDDSTKERLNVHNECKIPTFTCNQACELFL